MGGFEAWCEKKWNVIANWAVVPCIVHVSPACLEQARAAYPEGTDIRFGVCFKIATHYYPELVAKYRTGQIAHKLAEPMQGTWHVLLHLDWLYLDDQEHPVPTVERRSVKEPDPL